MVFRYWYALIVYDLCCVVDAFFLLRHSALISSVVRLKLSMFSICMVVSMFIESCEGID